MSRFKNLKFKYKLMLSYLIVAIIPITILGSYAYLQAKNYLLSQAERGLSESVSQMAKNISYKFDSYVTMLNFLDFNSQIKVMFGRQDKNYYQQYLDVTQSLSPLFETVLHITPDFDHICVYTDNSYISVSSRPDAYIKSVDDISRNPWFNEVASDNKIHWVINGGQMNAYVRFIDYFKGQPLNILCVTIDYNKAFNASTGNAGNYCVFIADDRNRILFSQNLINDQRALGIENNVVGDNGGKITFKGVKYLLIKEKIPSMGWNLFYCSPVSAAIINTKSIVVMMIIIVLSCLLIMFFMIMVLTKTIVRRILKLNSQMKQVEAGDLSIRVYSQSKDEIGDLTNSFGNMLDKLNLLIEENYKQNISEKEAQLRALQAQITPHFLYNALSLINWEAILINSEKISRYATSLSAFYRSVLNSGRNTIAIHDEIGNIKNYLEIQLAFHKQRFDVEYNIEENIGKYYMINMVLQPILENAIEHGIDMKAEGKGSIIISGYLEEDRIVFQIQDNGPGMSEDEISTAFCQDNGRYGLSNVQKRLALFYGDGFGIKLKNVESGGLLAQIEIPPVVEDGYR